MAKREAEMESHTIRLCYHGPWGMKCTGYVSDQRARYHHYSHQCYKSPAEIESRNSKYQNSMATLGMIAALPVNPFKHTMHCLVGQSLENRTDSWFDL